MNPPYFSSATPLRTVSRIAMFAVLIVPLAACESLLGNAPYPFHDNKIVLKSGPDAVITHDGLVEVEHPIMRRAFVRPDVDWSGYDRILLEPLQISVEYSKRNKEREHEYGDLARFELEEDELDRLRADFQTEMVKSFEGKNSFRVVTKPGPGVLRISSILTEYMLNAPTRKTRNSQAKIFTGATSTLSFMADGRDAVTGDVLVRVADTKQPAGNLQLNNAANNRADVQLIFRVWGNTLRRRLETLREQGVVSVSAN